jgi:hypothetical protein
MECETIGEDTWYNLLQDNAAKCYDVEETGPLTDYWEVVRGDI